MELKDIKGVGEKILSKLNKINIYTVENLINFLPGNYLDMSVVSDLNTITEGTYGLLNVEITKIFPIKYLSYGRSYIKVSADCSGDKIEMIWFNMPYLKNTLRTGMFTVWGKVNRENGIFKLINPTIEENEKIKNLKDITPIYPLKNEIGQGVFRKIMKEALSNYQYDNVFPDKFDLKKIYESIHYPKSMKDMRLGHYRLALYVIALDLLGYRLSRTDKNIGKAFKIGETSRLIELLPFNLTDSQVLALNEILSDIESSRSMNRLLLGDVGSGKTVVAFLAMIAVIKGGGQTVLLSPTEILNEQHYHGFQKLFGSLNIKADIIKADLNIEQRNILLEGLKKGNIDVLFGTHACLNEEVIFCNLKLAVIDELHKFGVKQKSILEKKGINVDVLVMSATPSPRTMAMTLYGDLSVSTIYRKPEFGKVKTYIFNSDKTVSLFGYISKKIDKGEKVYVVCPRLEDNDGDELYSAKGMFKIISERYLPDKKIGLIYGRQSDKEKSKIIIDFRNGSIDVLVSTTVIEVGIDIPDANNMIIMGSDHFGLATLHQLRGRIGRGDIIGECFLHIRTRKIPYRIKAMLEYQDGIRLAEIDAKERGYGDLIGVRQSGKSNFGKFKIKITLGMIKQAKEIADSYNINNGYLTALSESVKKAVDVVMN